MKLVTICCYNLQLPNFQLICIWRCGSNMAENYLALKNLKHFSLLSWTCKNTKCLVKQLRSIPSFSLQHLFPTHHQNLVKIQNVWTFFCWRIWPLNVFVWSPLNWDERPIDEKLPTEARETKSHSWCDHLQILLYLCWWPDQLKTWSI